MKLTDVHVDGFGVWSGLILGDLSPHCTVFYGPNEAGKTTLLQFLRAVLYGFSPERRSRYLPPVRGGAGGGTLSISGADEGPLKIHRSDDGRPLGGVTTEATDGTFQGEPQLRRLLHDIEEPTYNNVFAVGLHEVQELGTLTDIDAARRLYSLTAGLDRVSLVDVQQELEHSRLRLMGGSSSSAQPGGDRPSQVGELLNQRDRLRLELAQLAGLSQRHGQLAGDRAMCEQQIAEAAHELSSQESELSALRAAVAAYDAWQTRSALETQLAAIARQKAWPTDAAPRMKRILSGIRQTRRRRQRIAVRRQQLAGELKQISLNEALCRQAARIEALAEHESWIAAAEQQLQAAEATANTLADQQAARFAHLQQAAPQISALAQTLEEQAWEGLRRPAATVRKAHRRYAAVDRESQQHKDAAENFRRQMEAAMAGYGQRDLTAAMEAAGQNISQLRRRIQLDEQIDQLAKTETELEHRTADLTQRQILPPTLVIAVGSVFVLGVVLLLSGLFLPASLTGSWGWPLAWLGLLGGALAVGTKITLERSVALQLDACGKQLAVVQSQAKQAVVDRDALDRTLPKSAGSLAVRLQAAEQELAKLEGLLPLETERQAAEQAAAEIRLRGAVLRDSYQQARSRWRTALAAAQLPETLSPSQAKEMLAAAGEYAVLSRRLADARADVERHRRELSALAGRIEQTFAAAGLESPVGSHSDQVRYLRRELAEHESRRRRRDALRLRRQKLRRRQTAIEQKWRRWRRRRTRLFTECHVADLAEFRRRAAEFARVESLTAQRDAAALEITSRVAGAASEAAVGSIIGDKSRQQVEDQLAASATRLDDTRRRQQRLFEQRGQLSEQIRLVGGDRRMAVKRFELAQVEQRLTKAVGRWQVLTVTGRLLDWIKQDYERNRQPETLRQASSYLTRMTDGHYRRVWTPFGENILLVDDAQGRPLGIDVLSRGTREQLFLSLRLALVALFARRGAVLPMILDDVLVNFDGHRAVRAVEVLHDFAAEGHQLLVFTCHEHVAQLFKNQRMDVRRLPSNTEAGRDLPFSIREELPPRRTRARRAKEIVTAAEPAPALPLVTSIVDTATSPAKADPPAPPDEDREHRLDPPEPLRRRLPEHYRRHPAVLTTEASSQSDQLLLLHGNVWVEAPQSANGTSRQPDAGAKAQQSAKAGEGPD